MESKEICPHCIGAKKTMEPKPIGRGFVYIDCNYCKATGEVSKELADDYALSLNEDSIEFDDDFE